MTQIRNHKFILQDPIIGIRGSNLQMPRGNIIDGEGFEKKIQNMITMTFFWEWNLVSHYLLELKIDVK